MITEISNLVEENPQGYYSLVIGSDSQTKTVAGKPQIDFVTAIVVYRRGNGARYFWKKEKVARKPILRDKIYTETMRSLETAQELVPELTKAMGKSKYDLEIHIDVGQVGKTRDMIKEVVGMVTGSGYVAKTKPDSWAASSVADKHT
ncbi:ribonuclease H-like YkuK family protein [Candidatus Microgenomates bacterium]|nr:ribonuclease H-like YkuK family protein [Candidatus Microgenomates bacterium]